MQFKNTNKMSVVEYLLGKTNELLASENNPMKHRDN